MLAWVTVYLRVERSINTPGPKWPPLAHLIRPSTVRATRQLSATEQQLSNNVKMLLNQLKTAHTSERSLADELLQAQQQACQLQSLSASKDQEILWLMSRVQTLLEEKVAAEANHRAQLKAIDKKFVELQEKYDLLLGDHALLKQHLHDISQSGSLSCNDLYKGR